MLKKSVALFFALSALTSVGARAESVELQEYGNGDDRGVSLSIDTRDRLADVALPALWQALKAKHGVRSGGGYSSAHEYIDFPRDVIEFARNPQVVYNPRTGEESTRDYFTFKINILAKDGAITKTRGVKEFQIKSRQVSDRLDDLLLGVDQEILSQNGHGTYVLDARRFVIRR